MNYKYPKRHNAKVGQKEANYICRNYVKYGMVGLSKILKLSVTAIDSCLILNKIQKLQPKRFFCKNKNWDKIDKRIIKKLYLSGCSTRQLARKFNVDCGTIMSTLIKLNVTTRNTSERNHKNSRYVTQAGYIRLTPRLLEDFKLIPTRTTLEHRLVMARSLNRPLFKHENVHHINGNRQDNRLINLELWSTFQLSGQRVSDKIKYAKEILRLYNKK